MPEERRVVTILFARAAGLADLPELHRASATDGLFTRLRSLIERHGGAVDKFIGDTVMALWGAPVAHEDDTLRAVRAALAMCRETEEFGNAAGIALALGAGLNRGEVLFGSVGGDRATVMGDAVNVAQRLEAAAAPGQVLATVAVEKLTRRVISWRPLPPLHVKGRSEPVEAVEAAGENAGRTEHRLAPGSAAPLVGRAAEMERLMELAGRPRAAFAVVTGDAGVGKSRLVAEFRREMRLRHPEKRALVGRALQDVRLPLFAFGEMLRNEAGTGGTAADEGGRLAARVGLDLAASVPDPVRRENLSHLVAMSLGYSISGARVREVEPARMQAEMHHAWEQWFRAMAGDRGLLLCVEDLHWADQGTLDLLRDFTRTLADAPVLVLATARPEFAGISGWETVRLDDVGPDAAFALASAAFGAPPTPELAAFLVEKSGGNPYYIEELVRFLKEENLVAGSPVALQVAPSRVPDGLQGLLTARLDGLASQDKECLKAAGALGRVFWRALLGRLVERDVESSLQSALRRDLVYAQDASLLPDDSQFIFKHALLRDAAYALLTKKERQRLHAAAGNLLEARVPEAGRRARVLAARHREAAGQAEAAVRLLYEAAREAIEDNASAEGLAHAREALRLGGGAQVRLAISNALRSLGKYREALEEARVAAAGLQEDPDAWATARLCEAYAHYELGEFAERLAASDAALAAAQRPSTRSDAAFSRALALRRLGRMPEAEQALQEARSHAEDPSCIAEERVHVQRTCRFDMELARIELARGKRAEAESRLREAIQRARDASLHGIAASCLTTLGTIFHARGDFERALATQREVLDWHRQIGDRGSIAAGLTNIGNAWFRLKSYENARAAHEEALGISRALGRRESIAACLGNLGNVLLEQGRPAEALAAQRESLAIRRDIGNREGAAIALHNIGTAHDRCGAIPEAIASYRESLSIARDLGHRAGIAHCLCSLGRTLVSAGDSAEGLAALRESLELYRALGDAAGIRECEEGIARAGPG